MDTDIKEITDAEKIDSVSPSETKPALKTTSDGIPLIPQPSDEPEDPLVYSYLCSASAALQVSKE